MSVVKGQELWQVTSRRRSESVGEKVTVVSVGRKYFKTRPSDAMETKWAEVEWHLESRNGRWSQNSEYTLGKSLYPSEKHYKDEIEASQIHRELSQSYFGYGATSLSR